MEIKIRILLLDYSENDRQLIKDSLLSDKNEFFISEAISKEIFEKELIEGDYDLVVSDINIPGFDGLQVLQYVEENKPGTPIIIATGIGSEEIAIQAIRMGAADYITKSACNLKSLGRSIHMVLENKKAHTERNDALFALHEIEEMLRSIYNNANVAILLTSPEGKIFSANESACKLLKMTEQELCDVGRNGIVDLTDPRLQKFIDERKKNEKATSELTLIKKDGTKFPVEVSSVKFTNNKGDQRTSLVIRDLSEQKLAQEAIYKEKLLLRTLIDNLPHTVYVKDKDGRKLIANTADLKLMKCNSENEVIGKTDIDIFKNEEGKRGLAEDMSVIQSGKPLINFEDNYTDPEGKQHWRLTNKIPLFDNDKNIIGLIGYGFDITERKQAEIELVWEQYLMHSLLDNIPDSIYFKDKESRFIRINKHMADYFGIETPLDAIGLSDNDFFEQEHAQKAFSDEQEIIRTGIPIVNKEEKETWPDKEPTWVSTTKMPLKNIEGEIIGTFGISRNITERKKSEEDLIQAKKKAEESDKLKTAFLNNISHEIRTPMNAIIGFSSCLKDERIDAEKRNYFIDIIIKGTHQLLSIINDIVNISTLETNQEKLLAKVCNVNSIFRMLYNQFSRDADAKKISLVYNLPSPDDESVIVTDETKFIQVLSNLLNNALKFTKEGRITFGYTAENEHFEFYVKDTGIGISSDLHEKIFERFRQAESTMAREYGGSGLGLSIAKAYIELMGGKIWVSSEPEKGSTFYFTVPYKKPEQPEKDQITTFKAEDVEFASKKTILIVEDEEPNYLLLLEILADLNCNILWAENGQQAVDICKSNENIDLVLMDLRMPVMNGFDATKQIKILSPKLPVIAQTSYSGEADMQKALLYGCDDYITKPYGSESLLAKITELINKKQVHTGNR